MVFLVSFFWRLVWGVWPGGISFILEAETENEGEPVMAEEEFELGNVFKVAGVIALVVLVLGIVGLFSNL